MKNLLQAINEPDLVWQRFYAKISKQSKLAFCCGALFMAVTHIFFFMGRFANEDDHNLISRSGAAQLSYGRWANNSLLHTDNILPVVLWVIAILAMAFSVVCVVNILRLKKPIFIVLTAALMATFPSFAESFGYLFSAEGFSMGYLVAALAVYVTVKYKYGFLPGALLFSLALGYTQANAAVAMTLCALSLLRRILDEPLKVKGWLTEAGRCLGMGVGGVVCYFAILKLMLNLYNVTLHAYKGVDTMGQLDISLIPQEISYTYGSVWLFLQGNAYFGADGFVAFCRLALFFLLGILALILLYRRGGLKSPLAVFAVVVLLMLMPLCVNFTEFASQQSHASAITTGAFAFLFIGCFPLLELLLPTSSVGENKATVFGGLMTVTTWIVVIMALTIAWNNFIFSNLYYNKVAEYYEYTVALNNRVLDRMENTPGFTLDTPVAIISPTRQIYGKTKADVLYYPELIKADQGLWGPFIGYSNITGEGATSFRTTQKVLRIMENTLGVKLQMADNDSMLAIIASEEFKNMPAWPAQQSVRIMDGVMVVKMAMEQ